MVSPKLSDTLSYLHYFEIYIDQFYSNGVLSHTEELKIRKDFKVILRKKAGLYKYPSVMSFMNVNCHIWMIHHPSLLHLNPLLQSAENRARH